MKIIVEEIRIRAYQDIIRLADDILNILIKNNEDIFEKKDDERVEIERLVVSDSNIDENKYSDDVVKQMIRSGIVLKFDNNLASSGRYGNGIIRLNPSKNQIKKYLNYYYNLYDGDLQALTKRQIASPLNILFSVVFRKILVHELRHYYDDVKTNGKYTKDSRSKVYYKNLYNKHTSEKWYEYFNLPHEYWARYTEYIGSVINKDFTSIDFPFFFDKFKKEYYKWDVLEKKAKRKLIKALYKFFMAKKEIDYKVKENLKKT